ncbi:MAG TPA: mannitol dehydrogenase family protein [Terrimesophilobacter sp.]|nr:mannitol dehydrogenase family protein [Terrimesophilobacter sp.]
MISPADFALLPASVARPTYDRSRLTAGIAHFGIGGFHRSHQARYLDELLERGEASDWAILGIGLLPQDARMRDVMRSQDHAYTLVLKHPDGRSEARVIGSIVDYLFAPDDPGAVIERLADPAIRIVSMTVTEGGYNISPATSEFDESAEGVVHDLTYPSAPRTVFGLVIEALRVRRERGIEPFTVLSCDNMAGNGDVARRTFSAFAALRDPELGAWVLDTVAFPNSMVDRITPQTTDEDRAELASRYGIEDAWPVVAESFTQWVIEDRFSLGRPPWERVGAQLVQDVTPYELMKLRLLNASHQALGYFGSLMGYHWVHEAATDPLITRLLERYWAEEAIPTLPPVPGVDLRAYTNTLLERYRNPAIRDTLARLCAEASDRIPTFLLPVVRAELAVGGPVELSAAVVASWARYAEGVDDQGAPIQIVDARRERLMSAARRQHDDPTAFIEDAELFGNLAEQESFVRPYLRALDLLHSGTAGEALEALLE